MTKTFGVNENNDLYIGTDGNLIIDSGITAIEESCQSAVQAQAGEMTLAVNAGMPNFQAIWVGVPNVSQFQAALRKVISIIPGVIRILDLRTNVSKDILAYQLVLLTTEGQTIIDGIVNGSNI